MSDVINTDNDPGDEHRDPPDPRFAYIPSGCLELLRKDGGTPLPLGARGEPGVVGYWLPREPHRAKAELRAALKDDLSWDADERDAAGDVALPGSICLLWRE